MELDLKAVDESVRTIQRLADEMRELLDSSKSAALSAAIRAGFPPKMTYTVGEAAKFTGISEDTLRRENAAGRLKFLIPEGATRGAVIRAEEIDRWMASELLDQ